jgi:hypothetical protein
MSPVPLLCGLLAVVALALCPAGAAAQGPEVFVDPNSPSGREYELPLESARQQADPRSKDGPIRHGERSAPLFGEGINSNEQAGGAKASGRSRAGGGDSGPRGNSSPSRDDAAGLPQTVRQAISRPPSPGSGGATGAWLIGGGGLIVIGAGLGWLLRRRGSA